MSKSHLVELKEHAADCQDCAQRVQSALDFIDAVILRQDKHCVVEIATFTFLVELARLSVTSVASKIPEARA
jgi:hypothetical protein